MDIFAFDFDKPSWDAFKLTSKSTQLLMPCCNSRAIPKTSKLGTFFFSHKSKGDCTSQAESQEHLYLKGLIARAAKDAGWDARTEWPGTTPTGEAWIADVYCTRGKAKVALEVQLSKQTKQETIARQERYKQSGVRCAWIGPHETFAKIGLMGSVIESNKDLPFFRIASPSVGVDPLVEDFDIPLSQFIVGLLQGRLSWVEKPWIYEIFYVDDVCWKCRKPNKQTCGYSIDWHTEIAKTVPNASTVLQKMLETIISNDALTKLGLNSIAEASQLKGNAPRFPYCNHCLHCGSPQNNHYLMQKIGSPAYEEATDGLKCVQYQSPSKSTGSWIYKDD